MLIWRPSLASATGWTVYDGQATVTFNNTWDSQTAALIDKSAGGWNEAGIVRAWPSTGIGYTLYWDWDYTGSGVDHMMGVRKNSNTLAISQGVYMYHGGVNRSIYDFGASIGSAAVGGSAPRRMQARMIVNADGTL